MSAPTRSVRTALVLLAALLTALVSVTAVAPTQAEATTKQRVYGAVNCPRLDQCPNIKVMWFDSDWSYLGQMKASGGGYAVKLAPGTYHLQFTDQRQSWITTKYAPTNVTVRVGSRPVAKNVTMRRGGAITGVATGGGKRLGGARIVAANRSKQSFATTANSKGQFAVGGLPAGKYCLFTYDKKKRYVGKCTWVGGIDYRQVKNKAVRLRQKSGNLTVFVDTSTGSSAPSAALTVTSKATGQWWTSTVKGGKAVFRGVYPGRYRFKYDGGGVWLPATGAVRHGKVRASKMSFGNVRLTKRGGWVTGTVVDGGAPSYTLEGAQVLLFDQSGQKLAQATSDSDGIFKLTGQITTQNVTLVVNPNPNSGGYMQGASYCVFEHTDVAGTWQVRTGEETYVGDVALDRAPDDDQPDNPLCLSSSGRAQAKRMSSSAQ